MDDWSCTFCILPWIHVANKPSGTLRLCCKAYNTMAVQDSNPARAIKLGVNTIEDYWNSEFLRSRRARLTQGERLPDCQICYREEAEGKTSKRQIENRNWFERLGEAKIRELVDSSRRNDGRLAEPPIYFDLRLGNLCNLKCRSCNSLSSQRIFQENQELRKQGVAILPFMDQADEGASRIKEWYRSPTFWRDFEKYLPSMREIYLTGGEPTLIAENLEFLKKCVESGYASQMLLRINTNLTHIDSSFIDVVERFKQARVIVSIDAYGSRNNYLRYPSKWEVVERNLRLLCKSGPQVHLAVQPTVQAYNILYLDELCRWVEEFSQSLESQRDLAIYMNPLHIPAHLNCNILTNGLKELAEQRINDYLESSDLILQSGQLRLHEDLLALIKLMKQIPADINALQRDFKNYTLMLDRHRGQCVANVFPELQEMF